MKRVCLFFAAILVICLFFSCSSVKVIEIETYNPAAITFSPEIKSVMIVNNSAQQPSGVGHSFVKNMISDSLISVSADSTAYNFCLSLGKAIAESPLFHDVRICEDTLRRDSLFFEVRPFKAFEVDSLCNEYGVDALISLDKFFFTSIFHENNLSKYYSEKVISVDLVGEMRVLWPGLKEVFCIPFVDSLSWYVEGRNFFGDYLEVSSMPDTQIAMQQLSESTGYNMRVNFVPYWSEDRRWFYKNFSSDWKQGTAYAVAEKWKEAAEVWEPLYAKTKNWKQRAKLASNIALCNEITGDFEKAVNYAELSYSLYKEFAEEGSPFTILQSIYLEAVKKRLDSDNTLSRQLMSTGNLPSAVSN